MDTMAKKFFCMNFFNCLPTMLLGIKIASKFWRFCSKWPDEMIYLLVLDVRLLTYEAWLLACYMYIRKNWSITDKKVHV